MKTYTEEEVANMLERAMQALIRFPFECSITLLDYELTSIFGSTITNHFQGASWLVAAYREEEEWFEEQHI